MPLPLPEREVFLSQPHVAALSVGRSAPGRAPLSVPVWYWYEPGHDLWLMTGRDSVKAKAIAAAGCVTLLVERLEPTIRYVSVEGPVVSREPSTPEEMKALAFRYLPAEKVEDYLRVAQHEQGPQITVRIRPEHWLSADLGTV
ncbi:pyridoxamine 5'-phosphate oxidase family protein [Streptomyces sp. NPDC000877]|uniref:pyridoxamine 5'-phosphate oxidase family protein n=1 Tax=unclassified Streptomyces TaxID=2593676 RepID=UPI00331B63E9